jgi:bifunctional UDP-N-acetylglucosamine pyrophosphorylase/glucosamine-1-phosphate N-acetyltransferase
MKVLVLAAGRSKRLHPVGDKNLLKFNGKPLIQWRIESLAKAGLTSFIIVGGEHNMLHLEKVFFETPYEIKLVQQEDLDEGMAGAVKSSIEAIGTDPLLIVSGNDSVDQGLIHDIVDTVSKDNPDALFVGKKVDQYFPGGYIEEQNGYMTNIVEKPGEGNEPSDMINLVYHYYKKPELFIEVLKRVKSSADDAYEVAVLESIQEGLKVKVLPYNGRWQAIKHPWHVVDTARFYHALERAKGISPKANIHRSATITGEVIIEEGVTIHPNAVVQGPAYIGIDSVIAVNAFIRDSYIGKNCVIGFGTEVARSYIGENSWTHNNYIGDSIIGDNVSFGAGTKTGNLRLDELEIQPGIKKLGLITGNDLRVGINTSFMPGIKVGNNCMIGAGLIIAEDIPDNSFVKFKTKLTIKENTKPINPRN